MAFNKREYMRKYYQRNKKAILVHIIKKEREKFIND